MEKMEKGRIQLMKIQVHATGDAFISSDPIFIKVVRSEGPQLSLIDLPGMTHNSDKMENIHEVTQQLVTKYIKQEEMVILCVLPAMSDFGNAEAASAVVAAEAEAHRHVEDIPIPEEFWRKGIEAAQSAVIQTIFSGPCASSFVSQRSLLR